MRYALYLAMLASALGFAVAMGGCTAPALHVSAGQAPDTVALCDYPTPDLLVFSEHCAGRTAGGIDCYRCRDYSACLHGQGSIEAESWCVDAALGCADPACQF
jgi:hypothetical protein